MGGQTSFLPTRLSIDPTAFIAPGVVLVGDVTVGAQASIWYGCVLRGDLAPIVVGPRTNIQDGSIVHVDEDCPALIGADVTVGHRCVVHGAVLENGCQVGMGAVVLSGARIGEGALVAGAALVREGFVVKPRSLYVGVPAAFARELDEKAAQRMRLNAEHYVRIGAEYREGRLGGGPHAGR